MSRVTLHRSCYYPTGIRVFISFLETQATHFEQLDKRNMLFFESILLCLHFVVGNIVSGLWLSEWEEIGQISRPVTQHFGVVNNVNNEIILAGGIISSTSATNEFQTISLELSENEHGYIFPSISWSNTTDYHAIELDIKFSLSEFYQHHQSSGIWNNKIYIVEPNYGGDLSSLYFLSCDIETKDCAFISDLNDHDEWNYFQPCVTQKDEFLYIVGGINGVETTNQILVFDMENEIFVNESESQSFGPLSNGQVFTGCSVCNDKLYVIGGDCNGQVSTNHIQQCSKDGQSCQTLNIHLSSNLRWPRAVCVNDQAVIIAGGEPDLVSYSDSVDILDVSSSDVDAISIDSSHKLPVALNYFQLLSVFDDSYICTVGGQCIEDGMASVDDRIFCSKVLSSTTTPGPDTTTQPGESTESSDDVGDSDSSLFGNSSSTDADLWWLWMLLSLLLVACLLAMFTFKQRKDKKKKESQQAKEKANKLGGRHNSLAVASKKVDQTSDEIDDDSIESESEPNFKAVTGATTATTATTTTSATTDSSNKQDEKLQIEKQHTDAILTVNEDTKTLSLADGDAVIDSDSYNDTNDGSISSDSDFEQDPDIQVTNQHDAFDES